MLKTISSIIYPFLKDKSVLFTISPNLSQLDVIFLKELVEKLYFNL